MVHPKISLALVVSVAFLSLSRDYYGGAGVQAPRRRVHTHWQKWGEFQANTTFQVLVLQYNPSVSGSTAARSRYTFEAREKALWIFHTA